MTLSGHSSLPRLLVTGGSGFLGWELIHKAREEWNVCATFHSNRIDEPGISARRLDLRSFRELKELGADFKPEAVIHLAALSQPNVCQENPLLSKEINVTATSNLAGLAADRGIPFVFTSSDLVFAGDRAPYSEEDPPDPVSLYAEHKAVAEEAVRAIHPDGAVRRMPMMFGPDSPSSHNFSAATAKSLREGKPLKLFTDEFRTPLSSTVASEALLQFLHTPGLLHLGGPERVSRYDLGLMIAEALEINSPAIKPLRQEELEMSAPRPKDVSLKIDKAKKLGFEPPALAQQIREVAPRW